MEEKSFFLGGWEQYLNIVNLDGPILTKASEAPLLS